MLRNYYSGLSFLPTGKWAGTAVLALALSGCSMSFPMLGAQEDAPLTTGSIAVPVQVQQPLPGSLAYSDAAKIGQAAAAALWQADSDQASEWVNATTGSSGTIERGLAAETAIGNPCRSFSTIVTSIGGVHSYAGSVCQSGTGRSTVQLDAPAEDGRS